MLIRWAVHLTKYKCLVHVHLRTIEATEHTLGYLISVETILFQIPHIIPRSGVCVGGGGGVGGGGVVGVTFDYPVFEQLGSGFLLYKNRLKTD